jgi:hypothetical protein
MKACIVIVALALAAGPAMAQRSDRDQKGSAGKNQGTSKDQRERMRDDMREVNRDRNRQERPRQQLSPQEREKLRRDIQDANRDLRR